MEHQRLSSVSPADTGCSMESPAPDHQDAHSSEEELEVINSSVVQTRPTRSVPPEKRKWSQIVSGSTGTNAGGNEENVSRYGNLSPSTLGFANVVTVLEHSSDEEMTPSSLQIGMTTPVQFRTSPPLEAVKPGRRISSPPPKLVHYEASPRKRSRHRPHTLTQRPYLDFEKMQQLKTRSVAWKHNVDHSGELSVYCWWVEESGRTSPTARASCSRNSPSSSPTTSLMHCICQINLDDKNLATSSQKFCDYCSEMVMTPSSWHLCAHPCELFSHLGGLAEANSEMCYYFILLMLIFILCIYKSRKEICHKSAVQEA